MDGVIARLKEKAGEIFGPFPVDVAYVYGSVAAGIPHPFSDLDVAVVVEENHLAKMSLREQLALELRIEQAIADITGAQNAEVRVVNNAPAILLGAVTCEGKEIYCRDDGHRVGFETYAWSRYFDYKPIYLAEQRASIEPLLGEEAVVKPEVVRNLLNRLEETVGKLRKLASFPREEFLKDFTKVESAKHLLQTAIQICIDIANHIIASERWRTPSDYADSFRVLWENGIIPDDFLDTAIQMVRLRNRLVHFYMEVDSEAVYWVLQKDLDDFERFAGYILKAFEEELKR
jgi:uncharacterized protein YutE (UPF0331/DUF86 family)/predicted nucleotidyltransferase